MDYTEKQPAEIFYISIDFKESMDANEVIDLPNSSFMVTDSEGEDVTDNLLESANTHVDGTIVYLQIKGGESGNEYKLTARIKTDQNNIYEKDLTIKVWEE